MLIRRYTLFVGVSVFLLLVAGALVTSTQSGLAVPDWPLSYGQLMPPMVGGILYEHGHRMIAAAVSTLVGLQLLVLRFRSADRRLLALGLAAFGAILAQAVLGGITVLYLLPPAVSSAHAGLAEIVFALTAVIALRSSDSWEELPRLRPTGASAASDGSARAALGKARSLAVAAAGAAYVQILLGALVRHTGAGLAVPDFPLSFGKLLPSAAEWALRGVPAQMAHRLGAAVVSVLVVLAGAALLRLRAVSPGLVRAGWLFMGLLALQLTLGGFSVWSRKAPLVTTAHLAVGALLWVTGVLVAVSLGRILQEPARAAAAEEASLPHPHEAGSLSA